MSIMKATFTFSQLTFGVPFSVGELAYVVAWSKGPHTLPDVVDSAVTGYVGVCRVREDGYVAGKVHL